MKKENIIEEFRNKFIYEKLVIENTDRIILNKVFSLLGYRGGISFDAYRYYVNILTAFDTDSLIHPTGKDPDFLDSDAKFIKDKDLLTLLTNKTMKKPELDPAFNNKKRKTSLTMDGLKKLYHAACSDWKRILINELAGPLMYQNEINVSSSFMTRMEGSINDEIQRRVFEEVFPFEEIEFSSNMLKPGKAMIAKNVPGYHGSVILIRTHDRLVSINDLSHTWDKNPGFKGEKIKPGAVLEITVK